MLSTLKKITLFFSIAPLFVVHADLFSKEDILCVNISLGKALTYQKLDRGPSGKITGISRADLETESLLHFGLSHHRLLSNTMRLDSEISWLIYKSLCQEEKRITVHPALGDWELPAKYLIFVPITDIGLSKKHGNNLRLGAGLTYLWGLYAKAAMSCDKNLSVNLKCRWFFDRNLYHDGIHDMHVLAGLTYRI